MSHSWKSQRVNHFQIVSQQTGYHFGEVDLLFAETRRHAYRARTDCELLSLQKNDFQQIFFQDFKDIGAEIYNNALKRRVRVYKYYKEALEFCESEAKMKKKLHFNPQISNVSRDKFQFGQKDITTSFMEISKKLDQEDSRHKIENRKIKNINENDQKTPMHNIEEEDPAAENEGSVSTLEKTNPEHQNENSKRTPTGLFKAFSFNKKEDVDSSPERKPSRFKPSTPSSEASETQTYQGQQEGLDGGVSKPAGGGTPKSGGNTPKAAVKGFGFGKWGFLKNMVEDKKKENFTTKLLRGGRETQSDQLNNRILRIETIVTDLLSALQKMGITPTDAPKQSSPVSKPGGMGGFLASKLLGKKLGNSFPGSQTPQGEDFRTSMPTPTPKNDPQQGNKTPSSFRTAIANLRPQTEESPLKPSPREIKTSIFNVQRVETPVSPEMKDLNSVPSTVSLISKDDLSLVNNSSQEQLIKPEVQETKARSLSPVPNNKPKVSVFDRLTKQNFYQTEKTEKHNEEPVQNKVGAIALLKQKEKEPPTQLKVEVPQKLSLSSSTNLADRSDAFERMKLTSLMDMNSPQSIGTDLGQSISPSISSDMQTVEVPSEAKITKDDKGLKGTPEEKNMAKSEVVMKNVGRELLKADVKKTSPNMLMIPNFYSQEHFIANESLPNFDSPKKMKLQSKPKSDDEELPADISKEPVKDREKHLESKPHGHEVKAIAHSANEMPKDFIEKNKEVKKIAPVKTPEPSNFEETKEEPKVPKLKTGNFNSIDDRMSLGSLPGSLESKGSMKNVLLGSLDSQPNIDEKSNLAEKKEETKVPKLRPGNFKALAGFDANPHSEELRHIGSLVGSVELRDSFPKSSSQPKLSVMNAHLMTPTHESDSKRPKLRIQSNSILAKILGQDQTQ